MSAFLMASAPAASAAPITVNTEGAGSGTVTSSPAGINCSWNGLTATKIGECGPTSFPGFLRLTLTASPDAGSFFAGWSGGSCSGSEPCSFFPQAPATVSARFGIALPPPSVTIAPPVVVGPQEATFQGTVNPNSNDAKWHFEYRRVASSNWTTIPAPDGDAGSGATAMPVQATVEDLEPNREYEVRLHAANETTSADSAIEAFHTLPSPPSAQTKAAWSITDTGAQLFAVVNPNNAEVIGCRFEYGPTIAYGTSAPCEPAPGSGGAPGVQVSARVEGLAPATIYHFRIVATNACATGCGAETGEDATFTTYPSFVFPVRAYELVSAADTNGLDAWPPLQESTDGDHFAYGSFLPVPNAEDGGAEAPWVSSRQPGGTWRQTYVGPPIPRGQGAGSGAALFSANLGQVVWSSSNPFNSDDQNGADDIYARSTDTGAMSWLSRSPAIPAGTPQTDPLPCAALGNSGGAEYVSASGGEVLISCARHLQPTDVSAGGAQSLYEWREGGVALVGIRPESEEGFAAGSSLGSVANRRGDGGENLYGNDVVRNAVSRDGSRIVFQSGADQTHQHLYVRIDGESTVEASASEGVSPSVSEPVSVNYWGADENDEAVFFTSGSALTADSNAPGTVIDPDLGGGSADLYRYSVPANGDSANGRLVDLTPGSTHPGEAGAGILQVLGVSNAGTRIYFVSNGALTSGSEPGDCAKTGTVGAVDSGACNLYVAELSSAQDETLSFKLIARGRFGIAANGSSGLESTREVYATPDGSVLAFLSATSLVPGRQAGGFQQVYVYDAGREELSCASCPQDGSAPSGPAGLTPARFGGTAVTGLNGKPHSSAPHARNISATQPPTVLFQTMSSLSPRDSNEALDVYEWRGGRVNLVSSAGRLEADFAGASADGMTVFISTPNVLAPGGQSAVYTIYAARVGGGYHAPTPPPLCSGESCRAATAAAPPAALAASEAARGSGNLNTKPARSCPKGKRKVSHKGKARCVRTRWRHHGKSARGAQR